MRDVPELSFETIKRMEDMTWFTHAQIFDDLLIVSQRETSCYILKTCEGLVVIDGIWHAFSEVLHRHGEMMRVRKFKCSL